jgi:hypothetical protein
VLVRHQLDIAGLRALFMSPARVLRSAIVLQPSTLLHLHQVMAKRRYRMLFSPKHRRQPGPKGPKKELIQTVVELKRRNPNWGCPRVTSLSGNSLIFKVARHFDEARPGLHVSLTSSLRCGLPNFVHV